VREVPFEPDRWTIDAAEHRFEEHLGRPALYLREGSALAAGIELEDGTIEVDLAFGPERSFPGAVWRVEDAGAFEWFFVRPHQSGNPDATQYTPVFNGSSGWQLYHGERYTVPLTYRLGEWLRLRIVFAGDVAEVYYDGGEEPALRVDGLKRSPVRGGTGVTGSLADAWFSRFAYAGEAELRGTARAPEPLDPRAVRTWSVSDPFPESALACTTLDPALVAARTWTELATEPSGLADLARVARLGEEADTVLARTTVRAGAAGTRLLELGFSDRVRAYLNGRLLFAADDSYRSRDYRFLGSIGWWDTLALPLEAGGNELVLAVSESFGGWGVQARFADPEVELG
jgi:hypothetical protein